MAHEVIWYYSSNVNRVFATVAELMLNLVIPLILVMEYEQSINSKFIIR